MEALLDGEPSSLSITTCGGFSCTANISKPKKEDLSKKQEKSSPFFAGVD